MKTKIKKEMKKIRIQLKQHDIDDKEKQLFRDKLQELCEVEKNEKLIYAT